MGDASVEGVGTLGGGTVDFVDAVSDPFGYPVFFFKYELRG